MADKKSLAFLKELTACYTPSGFEQDGQRVMARYLAQAGVESAFDVHGNLHAVLNEGAPVKVMLEAHCDEIGFLVSYIDAQGFLWLIPNGGVTTQTVLGERVVILGKNGPVHGVFGVRPPHLMTGAQKDNLAPKDLSDIPVDIGATSKEEAEALVALGAPAVVDAGWLDLAGDRVACRGFDNRIGAYIVTETMRRLAEQPLAPLNVALHLVGSVQEELGLIGGQNAAQLVKPDIGICVDVGFATDAHPADARKMGDVKLGGGPILGTGPFYNNKLRQLLLDTAKLEEIPLQMQVRARASGNNAYAMRMFGGNTAVALVSIPLRYMHSPVETLDLNDVERSIRLLCAFLGGLPANPDLTPTL
ncbi:MAG: M42 family peptidase [Kiritimatiellae bacterium]|nr:M42 family peptidase [Kiritimatiellia bacterium]